MDKSYLEQITLPSDYDISRVQMTATKYDFKSQNVLSNKTEINPVFIEQFDFLGFRKKHEERIIFFKEKDFATTKTTAEKVLRIVTSQKYRAGTTETLNLDKHKAAMLENINYFIEKDEPVQFMFPAFPFKIKNPLKSARADADLAEVASFCKFNEIHLQIQKVYPKGAQFHVFHDGHLYYRHFLHTIEDADRYFSSLKSFVNKLRLDEIIKLHDAFEELKKFDEFPQVYERARKEMEKLWSAERDANRRVSAIRKSSHDNINLSDISEAVLLEINTKKAAELPEDIKKVKTEIDRRADACAFEYMTVQHALEKLDFFSRSVPHGIRMTVHPKEGQIGIYLVKKTTFLLPWMGVGILKKNSEASVRYEIEVKNNPDFVPIIIKGEKYPFYYEQK